MIVVDASVLVVALADDGPDGDQTRTRLRGQRLFAPEIVDLEVLSALRSLARAGSLDARRSRFAVDDLADLPLSRAPHLPLIPRCWELRDNLTAYDGAYVALAEMLGAVLLTGDHRLVAAPGLRCAVELLPAAD